LLTSKRVEVLSRDMPEVSVVVWAPGSPRTLRRAIESVLGQTFQSVEIVVVDPFEAALPDGDWGDRVTLVRHAGNEFSARNAGAARAAGRWLAFLTADDVWLPRKLQWQVWYFERFPTTGLLYARSFESENPMATVRETRDSTPLDVATSPPAVLSPHELEVPSYPDLSTVIVRREVFEEVGGFVESTRSSDADLDFWRRVASRHPVGYLDLVLSVRQARPVAKQGGATVGRSANLVHDTVYGRIRRKLARSAHAIDDALRRPAQGERARVLFEAASPLSMAVFKPVLDRLRQDPRIDIRFTTSDGSWSSEDIFGSAGIASQIIQPNAARLMKFDVYVNTDFWNMTWLSRQTRRVHLFHGVAGKYGLDAPVHIAPVVASFDRLLFPNIDRLKKYEDAGLIDPEGPEGALVGYPKVDCLVDGSLDRPTIQRELGLDPSRPTVLYAPTWSPYSSLQTEGFDTIRGIAATGVNTIVKLHDRSFDLALRSSGGIDWRGRLARLRREYPILVADGPDVSRYLVVADALVTDHSSVGFEFMLLDRPLVVIDCPRLIERARVSADKVRLLHGSAEVVTRGASVAAAIARALGDPRRHGDTRRRIARELFYRPGSATQRAVQCLYDVLTMEAPQFEQQTLGADRVVPSASPCAPSRLPPTAADGDSDAVRSLAS
jgi:glycosyltransferase involved in cell wall biosynthesis